MRFLSFFFDEKDIFLLLYLLLIVVFLFFDLPTDPFNRTSLFVVGIFGLFTRSLVSALRFNEYFYIMLIGLFLSLFFSPYTVAIYLTLGMLWYTKKRF
jgi:hypothetical protein